MEVESTEMTPLSWSEEVEEEESGLTLYENEIKEMETSK